ncbi:hypothetical protein BK010_01845 [Tenericutes bacterium MO-XQ]|jgi:hypothetical protein|nr:hypothetical protein BK010_01845 [Tenericutes bacterium MO-XQ]
MLEQLIYFSSLFIFFAINLRILRALHIENKFEKFKIWEIKAAYFLVSLGLAHLLAEIMVKFSNFLDFI